MFLTHPITVWRVKWWLSSVYLYCSDEEQKSEDDALVEEKYIFCL